MDRNNILLRGILRRPFLCPPVGSNGLAAGCLSGRCGSERKYCDGTRTWAPRLAWQRATGQCGSQSIRAGEGDQVGIAILQRRFRLAGR